MYKRLLKGTVSKLTEVFLESYSSLMHPMFLSRSEPKDICMVQDTDSVLVKQLTNERNNSRDISIVVVEPSLNVR